MEGYAVPVYIDSYNLIDSGSPKVGAAFFDATMHLDIDSNVALERRLKRDQAINQPEDTKLYFEGAKKIAVDSANCIANSPNIYGLINRVEVSNLSPEEVFQKAKRSVDRALKLEDPKVIFEDVPVYGKPVDKNAVNKRGFATSMKRSNSFNNTRNNLDPKTIRRTNSLYNIKVGENKDGFIR